MSRAQVITYIRNGEKIRLSDEAVLEEARRAGRAVTNENLMDIIWGGEKVSPKEARRRFQPIYRATHNLVEEGALLEREVYNSETDGMETVYSYVPPGIRVPVPSKKGYKAKFEESQAEVARLQVALAKSSRVLCPACECITADCRTCKR